MKTCALIEVGESTVKFLAFTAEEGVGAELISKKKEDISLVGRALQGESMKRAIQMLKNYKEEAEWLRVDEIRLVGREILKKVGNIKDFVQKIKNKLNWEIEFLSEKKEAEMLYKGIAADFTESQVEIFVTDIKEKGTDIIFGSKSSIRGLEKIPIEVSKLSEEYLKGWPVSDKDMANLRQAVSTKLEDIGLPEIPKETVYILTDGDLAYMSALGSLLTNSSIPSANHPYKVTVEDFKNRADEIRRMSKNELRRVMPGNPKWVDYGIVCNTVAIRLAERIGVSECIPSENGLSEGLVLEMIS